MKHIKTFESVTVGDSEDQITEISDIFQEFADEYHMVKSVLVSQSMQVDVDIAGLVEEIPENIYYMIGHWDRQKDYPPRNTYNIEVWCVARYTMGYSDSGLIGGETKKMFNRFFDNIELLLNKLRGFGYTIIDSKKTSTGFVSGPWTYKLKII